MKLSPKCNVGFIYEFIWVKPQGKCIITTKDALLRCTVVSFLGTLILNRSVRGTDTMACPMCKGGEIINFGDTHCLGFLITAKVPFTAAQTLGFGGHYYTVPTRTPPTPQTPIRRACVKFRCWLFSLSPHPFVKLLDLFVCKLRLEKVRTSVELEHLSH